MKFLPSEIITSNIVSRLPVESVLYCMLVCKSWCQSIRNPYFRKIHQRQQLLDSGRNSNDKVSFLFLTAEQISKLYYGKYDEDSRKIGKMKLKIVNHPLINKKFVGKSAIVGSCNGLVCFTVPHTYHVDDPIYICNPNLGEKISLPRFTITAENKYFVVSGFGYNSITDEYKVVRIIGERYYAGQSFCHLVDKPKKSQVQVYTLGSGSGWRNIGEYPYSLQCLFNISRLVPVCCRPCGGKSEIPIPSRGILANGALHWLDSDWNIVAFDLEYEQFSLLPSPPCYRPGDDRNLYILQVLAGCLCVLKDQNGKSLDIWSFKKETREWEELFCISCGSDNFFDAYWPISLTSSGKLILRFQYKVLYCYDPDTGELEKLMNCNTEFFFPTLPYPLIEAIPHINSYVSLEALGERSKKIVRAMNMNV
ncbi:F-box protein At3g07870-like [Papaver somniferum]|uniref:F-box protein At3g07870-like n=1 Tax=Papaver somniferum TaxID=3469 RepID=UPI000E70466F|nr:F-box protein At3g07870-like [Papaver somniferum]